MKWVHSEEMRCVCIGKKSVASGYFRFAAMGQIWYWVHLHEILIHRKNIFKQDVLRLKKPLGTIVFLSYIFPTVFFLNINFIFMASVSLHVCPHVCKSPQRPEEDVKSPVLELQGVEGHPVWVQAPQKRIQIPSAGVTGSRVTPRVGAESWTWRAAELSLSLLFIFLFKPIIRVCGKHPNLF